MRPVFCCLFSLLLVNSLAGCAALGRLSPLGPVERAIVFQNVREADGTASPADGGFDAWFTTDDGVRLHGRFFDHPQPRAVALFCHGNAGSVAAWSEVARELNERHQLAVLVFDYRGYGRSAGSPSEIGILRDGRAARRWLAGQTGAHAQEIVLIGRSLGGAVAVDLAANGGARGLIIQNTFSSLPDVAASHAPWLAPHLMMTQRLDSSTRIKEYAGPVLQSHGDADRLIPLASARKLFDAVPGPKQFVVIPGADHNDPPGEAYAAALDAFLDALPVDSAKIAATEELRNSH